MAQVSQITINNQAFSTFRTTMNDSFSALNSMHSGTSRPASATTGTLWLDTTNAGSNSLTIKFFDGSDDITFATIDTSANTVNFIDSVVTGFDIVTDTTPQLGGNLDLNSNNITGTGNINITGTGTFSGDLTVDTSTLKVDSSNDRVGIGVASPLSTLHLFSSEPTLIIQDGGSHGVNATPSISLRDGSGAMGSINFSSAGLMRINQVKNSSLTFQTNNTERVRVDSSGNVGVGTASPINISSNNLTVSGSASSSLFFEDTGFESSGNGLFSLTYDDGNLKFETASRSGNGRTGNAEVMRIASDGKVSIGTTAANQKLNIFDSSNSQMNFYTSGTGTAVGDGFRVGFNGTVGQLYLFEDADFRIATNNSEKFRITSDGKVGIGTSSPGKILDIRTTDPIIQTVDTGDSDAVARIDANAGWLQLKADNNNTLSGTNITFSVDGSEKARIDSSGNLMVGTTSVQGGTAKTLQIADSGSARLLLQNTGGGRTYGFFTPTSGEFGLFDYTASATRLTFNTSGTLLIGRTDTTATNTGLELEGTGTIVSRRDGNVCMFLDRKTSDGTILEFRKDNSTVGIVFSSGGIQSGIGDGNTAVLFADNISSILPWQTDNNARDAGIDLGRSATRFKDIYLSGGAFLGGTGSANKLDDYEEGTWTPDIATAGGTLSVTYAERAGKYTKIGNVVYYEFYIETSGFSGGSGDITFSAFPFTAQAGRGAIGLAAGSRIDLGIESAVIIPDQNATTFKVRIKNSTGTGSSNNLTTLDASDWSNLNPTILYGAGYYRTDS